LIFHWRIEIARIEPGQNQKCRVAGAKTKREIPVTIGYVSRVRRKSKALPPLPERAAKMLARLKRVRGMSDDEKSVHALGLAATPEERWELNENFIRSLGYWKPLRRKKSATC
jgi:hypothetical protein